MTSTTRALARAVLVGLTAALLLPAPAAAAPPPGAAAGPGTVVVDPVGCRRTSGRPALLTVCTPAHAARVVRDGGTILLRPGTHRGPLDLRDRARVVVRGEHLAVLDAAGSRFALALRDVTSTRVRDLVLQGGTAQTVWVDRTRAAVLDRVVVQGSRGAGVQVRDSTGFRLLRSHVRDAASAGVMELTGVRGSTYAALVVTRNGRGPAVFDGDGMQLSGKGVTVSDVTVVGNGSDRRYEHGVYVSSRARNVRLSALTSRDNAGVALKVGGSGVLVASRLEDESTGLYCAGTAAGGWTVHRTRLLAPTAIRREASCTLARS